MWDRINSFIEELNFPHKCGKGDYIPESLFYLLGMKANNDVARKFQTWLAVDVIPSIRKTGQYTLQKKLPYKLIKKIYNERPVMILKDIEYITGVSANKLGYYIRSSSKILEVKDWMILEFEELKKFKNKNNIPKHIASLVIINQNGVYKILKFLGIILNEEKQSELEKYFAKEESHICRDKGRENAYRQLSVSDGFSELEKAYQDKVIIYINELLDEQKRTREKASKLAYDIMENKVSYNGNKLRKIENLTEEFLDYISKNNFSKNEIMSIRNSIFTEEVYGNMSNKGKSYLNSLFDIFISYARKIS